MAGGSSHSPRREESVSRVRIEGSGQGESLEDNKGHVGSPVVASGCTKTLT